MSKFTAFKNSKNPLFRTGQSASMDFSWPVRGDLMFPMPSKKDAITEHILFEMKLRRLLKLQADFGRASTLRVEAPRMDGLFKIRRVAR